MCSVLQCVAVCCSVLQCVAVCCSVSVCYSFTRITFMHECVYVCVYVCTLHAYKHTHIQTYIHKHMHTNVHTWIQLYIHTCTRTYTHTYTHTHIHAYLYTYLLYHYHNKKKKIKHILWPGHESVSPVGTAIFETGTDKNNSSRTATNYIWHPSRNMHVLQFWMYAPQFL